MKFRGFGGFLRYWRLIFFCHQLKPSEKWLSAE